MVGLLVDHNHSRQALLSKQISNRKSADSEIEETSWT